MKMMGELGNVSREELPRQNVSDSERFQKEFDTNDHQISAEELCSKLHTNLRLGLRQATAAAHLARDGKNLIVHGRRAHNFLRFLRCMFCGVALVLWITALHCIVVIVVLSVFYDEIGISQMFILFASVFHALIIGSCLYTQGENAGFGEVAQKLGNRKAEVIRDGNLVQIPTEEVAVGDLILLKYGEQIPADVRVVESHNFKVDNFALTGVHDAQLVHEETNEPNPLESPNVAFLSGMAIEGTARAIVLRTGARTLAARVSNVRNGNERFVCPITKKIISCLNKCSTLAVVVALTFSVVFWLSAEGRKVTDASLVSIILILAVIPEDILPGILLSMKLYCRYMSSKNCSLRNILALQKLPFVKTICLNKPGILTLNKVSVSHLWFDKKIVKVRGGTKVGLKERASPTFKELGRCALLCNEASFKEPEDEVSIYKREITGSCEEAAIFKFLITAMGKKVDRLREAYPKVFCLPSKLTNKFQASVHVVGGAHLVVLIGEPDYLLEKCSSFFMVGRARPIDVAFIRDIDKVCVQLATYGDKIKCVISQTISTETKNFDVNSFTVPERGYVFLGMVTLKEAPRPNISQAIEKCRQAGIKVILTTNDHPIMARTFARLIGVISEKSQTLEEKFESANDAESKVVNSVVIDGLQLKKLSLKRIQSLMAQHSEVVFARTSPIQKLMLIASCQQNDSVVAFVGDGINDALTMNKADLSVTLCDGEFNCSKVQSDVRLTDDSFYSFAACLEEGRVIYENLKKCSAYALTSNVPTALSVVAYCVIGVPLPLNPTGLVVAEVFLELFPIVALAFEKSEPGLMQQPPRDINKDKLWSRQMIFYACVQIGVIETFACFFTYFVIMQQYGWTPLSLIGIRDRWDSRVVSDLEDSYGQKWTYEARKSLENLCQTGYFYSLILVQLANVIVCRNQRASLLRLKDRNWLIQFGLLFEICITLFLIYLPHVNELAGMSPLKPIWWLIPLPYFFLIILYDQVKKLIIRRSPKGWLATETLY